MSPHTEVQHRTHRLAIPQRRKWPPRGADTLEDITLTRPAASDASTMPITPVSKTSTRPSASTKSTTATTTFTTLSVPISRRPCNSVLQSLESRLMGRPSIDTPIIQSGIPGIRRSIQPVHAPMARMTTEAKLANSTNQSELDISVVRS